MDAQAYEAAALPTTSTCVVGLIADGAVYDAADSTGVSRLDVTMQRDPKVFTREAGAAQLFPRGNDPAKMYFQRLISKYGKGKSFRC